MGCGLILTTWSDKISEHSDLEGCSTSNLGDISISCSNPCTTTRTAAKRKIASNPPSGKKKSKALVASEPSNLDVRDHLKQFPDEPFAVGKGDKLFCEACREIISFIIVSHIKLTKHSAGLGRLKSKQARQQYIAGMLKKYDQKVHPVGENLPEDVRVYRVKVVESFLKAGVPLSKIDCFYELLEENSLRLSSSTHLSHNSAGR